MNDSSPQEHPAATTAARAAMATGAATPLLDLPDLALRCGVARVLVKDESRRPLGNFKSLGGTIAGILALERDRGARPRHLICASDGNHGLAVALAASRAGASATVYLHGRVSLERESRISALGADVIRVAGTYDDAVAHAAAACSRGDGILIADTSEDPHDLVVRDVTLGYQQIANEIALQLPDGPVPTHLFVQAGVGGLAAALAEGLAVAGIAPRIVVVEPALAACVGPALASGHIRKASGDLDTIAEMLACGVASAPAVATLRRMGADSMTVAEEQLADAPGILRAASGPDTTPSGAAGLAGLLALDIPRREQLGVGRAAVVMLIVTEGV